MKKVVSMFVALAILFTARPLIARAEDECVDGACRFGPGAPQVEYNIEEVVGNETKQFGERAKGGVKWVYEKTLNGTKWIGSEVSDKWSNTVSPWLSEKADDAVKFEKQVEEFYNYDLNNQPKWTFWTLMTSAGVGVLTIGTWLLNLITCCCCGRCRLRMP